MPSQIKVDEDLPEDIAHIFSEAGYIADTVIQQGWGGSKDEELWERVQAEGRWLVTADKGFGDVRTYIPGTYVGIVLFRAEIESRRRYIELAQELVHSVRLEEISGSLVVVVVSLASVYSCELKVDHDEVNGPHWTRFSATKEELQHCDVSSLKR
jgi:predicted nuclease of predicted toxin-antitoxin system